ncbi:MAG: GntR family transcriptional regulator [Deltaproteobacteria bacterium]|nr:GntR family transcriptional regulator [Deltaproteobacteria bacterium]
MSKDEKRRGRGPEASIDRGSYEPPYVQLVGILRRQIAAGKFRAGDRLPSEPQLCSLYQVSPMTVRRAITILLDQGAVVTTPGKGTFVRPLELGTGTFRLQELADLLANSGRTAVRLLQTRVIRADERVARRLSIKEGQRAIYLRRLLFRDGDPVLYHQEYLLYDPKRPIVEAEMEATSLQGLFAGRGGSDFKGGSLRIEATALRELEADLLGGTVNQPAFRLIHIFYDYKDRPASWGWFICRGDRISFGGTLGLWEEK